MMICFFSDIHGNFDALKAFWNDVQHYHVDLFVFGGDIFGYYYAQEEVLDFLCAHDIKCLLGNHDKLFLDLVNGICDESYLIDRYGASYQDITGRISQKHVEFLGGLGSRYDLNVDGLRLVFVHGSIFSPLDGRIYPDTVIDDLSLYQGVDVVFMGHTHHKLLKKLSCGSLLINPGSIGQQRDGKGCSYIIFDTKTKAYAFHIIKYDVLRLIDEIKAHHEEKMTESRLIEVLLRGKK